MKLTTPEKILWCLEDLAGEVAVDPGTAARARGAIERMLEVVPAATKASAGQAS
jgi:quinolinate synthase